MTLLEEMKEGIKENKTTNALLNKMVSDGLSEEEAMNIMISVWIDKMGINILLDELEKGEKI